MAEVEIEEGYVNVPRFPKSDARALTEGKENEDQQVKKSSGEAETVVEGFCQHIGVWVGRKQV